MQRADGNRQCRRIVAGNAVAGVALAETGSERNVAARARGRPQRRRLACRLNLVVGKKGAQEAELDGTDAQRRAPAGKWAERWRYFGDFSGLSRVSSRNRARLGPIVQPLARQEGKQRTLLPNPSD